MSFVGAIQSFMANVGPWFIKNKNIGRFREALGMTLDASVTGLEQGLRLGQPLNCDTSALPILAKDRSLRLYPTEPTQSKRFRLSRWYQLHRTRGTHAGELKHSQPYFQPNTPVMRIVHQSGDGATATWWTIEADGSISHHAQSPSNWNYDGNTAQWSRFWAILYAPTGFLNPTRWDDGTKYDEGGFYDSLTSIQVALDLIDMIREWQSAHSELHAYIISSDPTLFDPTGTAVTLPSGATTYPVGNWGSAISPPPTMIRTRPPGTVWIYEA